MMKSNQRLLQEFRKTRSEAAFRELVERHLSLVHSVALRVTRNAEFARDVSQAVFLKLAQSSAVPAAELNLLAWLHRTTRNAAIDLIRSENRRRKREAVAHETMKIESSPADWSQLESVLEDVLANLSEKERGLILARYYQGHTHSTTAKELGISEDAARVRTKRALAKLQERLGKKGITTTAALLGSALSAQAVTPVSSSMVTQVCAAALVPSQSVGLLVGMGSLKKMVAPACVLLVSTPLVVSQFRETSHLKSEIQVLEAKREPAEMSPSPETTSQLPLSSSQDLTIRERSRQWDRVMNLFKSRGRKPIEV